MKTIQLTQKKNRSVLNGYLNILNGHLRTGTDEAILEFDNEMATGQISSVRLRHGISYLQYDMAVHSNFELIQEAGATSPVYFLYCTEDDLIHSFGTKGLQRKLGKFQTSILTSPQDDNSVLHFVEDRNYKVLMIKLDTQEYEGSENYSFNRELVANFSSGKDKDSENFAYVGSFNLKIADRIAQFEKVSQKNMVRTLLLEGIIHSVLGLEIQQFTDDMRNKPCHYGTPLTKSEMDRIRELSLFIKNYPEQEYTVKLLCAKAAMSSAKLQKGFKALHGRTVTHYIRNIRLVLAENMLRTTDLNISEIVYNIGLTSRSYFSKIFKRKYNCSPKHYQDRQNTFAVTG